MKQLLLLAGLLLSCNHIYAAAYSAPFWLPGGDIQTIYAAIFNPLPTVEYRRERWELPDGDFVDVDWLDTNLADSNFSDNTASNHAASSASPIVVLFHGLEGSSQSAYARLLMSAVKAKGWRGVVIHFRGCSGEPNRLPRVYYAGDTAEIDLLLSRVRSSAPAVPVYAVGVSLGGNALLKWLGEKGDKAASVIDKAVAVSAPIDLAASAAALDKGLNRILYTPGFVGSMRPKALAISQRFPGLLDEQKIKTAKTIHDIDNAVTAVLYGATDADDYYAKNAAKPWLSYIRLPTLILNAKNDPFIPASTLPSLDEVSASVTLEYPETGGHAGFPSDNNWFAMHLLEFFQAGNLSAAHVDN